MNWKLAIPALSLALTVVACAADATNDDPADAEEAASSQDELSANASKLVGAYHRAQGTFEGLVLQQDGKFFADVDTGIRCITTPCPSSLRIMGTFTATKGYLRLSPFKGEQATSFHGRFAYTVKNDALSLTRAGKTDKLDKENSYCAEPADCGGQGLIHPMCVGSWTCGTSAPNSCGYKCGGVVPNALFPANATKIVAENAGGGFTPPPPPGSTCAIGRAKYTYDIATKSLAWEQCNWSFGQNTPLKLETGTTKLTAAQAKKVIAAANAMTTSEQDICGADKPYLTVAVTSPAGTKKLHDSFYSCQGGNKTYVNGIDAVFAALSDAAN